MSDNFLMFMGVMLHIEQALLWLVAAQCATAIAGLLIALALGRLRRTLQ